MKHNNAPNIKNHTIEPPAITDTIGEAFQTASTISRALRHDWRLLVGRTRPEAEKLPVFVIPGMNSTDQMLVFLHRFLQHQGHETIGWNMGLNIAGFGIRKTANTDGWDLTGLDKTEHELPALINRVTEKVSAWAKQQGRPIGLVGWSLGGTIAREVARALPNDIAHVVTLGAPIIGGPSNTFIGPIYKARGWNLERLSQMMEKREIANPIQVPITAIVSRIDGVVAWQACVDHHSPNVRHIDVNVSHSSMGFDHSIWQLMATALNGSSE